MTADPSAIPSVVAVTTVYGDGVSLTDPAETYHEASRLYPATAPAQMPGLQTLQDDRSLQASVARSSRRHRHRPGVELPAPRPLRPCLQDVLECRCSGLGASRDELTLADLSTLLGSAYSCRRPQMTRRPVPSGGALYPLELYPLALAVGGAPGGLYHYDPFDHRLEQIDPAVRDDTLADVLVDPSLVERTSVALAISAVLWRTRFKYGQRGYRFALLEAGHVAQNLLLAAAALGVTALPLGGFYDRPLEAVLGVDGIDESALYVLLLGGSR